MHAYLVKMLRYTSWANERILAALREQPAAQAEGLPLLAHLLAAEHVWLTRLLQAPAKLPVWPQLSLEECAALVTENVAGYAALLRDLAGKDLTVKVEYRNTKGEAFATPVEEMLTHVVIHGGYHRGQIAKALGRASGKAVNTDYITYVREGGT
jgi:uncharacterized damage-inducible protein DinB